MICWIGQATLARMFIRTRRTLSWQQPEFIAPKVTGLRLQALQSLASAQPGLTGSQVAERMGAWLYSVKPRLTELQRMGLVADSGERARNERKRQEVVWKITDKGIDFLENHEWLIYPETD